MTVEALEGILRNDISARDPRNMQDSGIAGLDTVILLRNLIRMLIELASPALDASKGADNAGVPADDAMQRQHEGSMGDVCSGSSGAQVHAIQAGDQIRVSNLFFLSSLINVFFLLFSRFTNVNNSLCFCRRQT